MHTLVNGAGILDVHWENDNIIMSCGYDTYLRKVDLRTGDCVQIWEDPHDSALYCIASDDMYSILVGTISYGRVVLWDQRVHTKYVQVNIRFIFQFPFNIIDMWDDNVRFSCITQTIQAA